MKIRPIFKTIDIFSFIQFLSRQTNYIIKFFLLKVLYLVQHARMNNYMHPLVNKGAKNDMKVSAENALKGTVIFPDYREQKAISAFFARLDHLIALQQQELDKLQSIKKALLEKMFV